MIRVVGNYGCSRCEITKQILKNKGVDYEYQYLNDLSEKEQEEVMNMAKEKGQMALPIILRDNQIIEVKEI